MSVLQEQSSPYRATKDDGADRQWPGSRWAGSRRPAGRSPDGLQRSGRRFRRLGIAVLAMLTVAGGLAATSGSVGAAEPVLIYGDDLDSGFQNWSWATVDLRATAEVHGGSRSIAVDYGPWEGLYLAVPSSLNLPSSGALEFWMHGGDGPVGPINVSLVDTSFNAGPLVTVSSTPGRWTRYELPLAEFGSPGAIGGLWWQNGEGVGRRTIYIDDVRIAEGDGPPATPGPALTIDLGPRSVSRRITDPASGYVTDQVVSFPHSISDGIYGLNFAAPALRRELNPGVNRWGGNAVERYNFQNGTTNLGKDWYFMNQPGDIGNDRRFESDNQGDSVETLLTVPGIGWVATDRAARCGYPLDQYSPMDDSAAHFLDYGLQCGNGQRAGETVAGTPETTSTPVGSDFTRRWVTELVAEHGSAAEGGVELYAIGNEPGLWHATHSDVVEQPVGRTAIIDNNIDHAAAIKSADATASVVGPVLWGGYSYYVTSAEQEAGLRPGAVPTFVESYLSAMADAEQAAGQRLLDGLAINFYDDRVFWGGTDDLRLESTRSLWDPTYAPQDWWVIRDFVGEGHAVIPRMRSLIDNHYPGTELNITEYNFGALDTLAGGLTQADALGIFGREGLDRAMLWDPYNEQLSAPLAEFIDRPAMWAYRMYRNYDGDGGSFGDRSLFADSADQDLLSIYGAERTSDGAITTMVINKSTSPQTSTLTVPGVAGQAEVYRYGGDDLQSIEQLADVALDGSLIMSYPARSITLLVVDTGNGPEPEPEPQPQPEPEPQSVGPCVPGRPDGSIAGQPEFVGCRSLGPGLDTAASGPNWWLDEFDHGRSFAALDGPSYRVFDGLGVAGSVHWQHGDHWMVDVANGGDTGGAMLSPGRAFRFEDGRLIVEADVATRHPDYLGAWPELIISTGDRPGSRRRDGLYGYDRFKGQHTLGCRLQLDSNTICSLMDDSPGSQPGGGRIWEMSWLQQVGQTSFGGNSFIDGGRYFRTCQPGQADTACRDRIRLELTKTSLTIYVNGFRYFEQTRIPELPAAITDGEIYVYYGSMVSRQPSDAVRFHWDRLAVNPATGPTPADGFR